MLTHHETDDRVLEVIVRSPDRMLDEVALECPDLTWNQVFIAIDRLSREGMLLLTPNGRGLYTVRLSNQALHQAGHLLTVETHPSQGRRRGPLDKGAG